MKVIITLPHIRKITAFEIHNFLIYNNALVFISTQKSKAIFPFNGALFTQEIPNEIILFCMDFT